MGIAAGFGGFTSWHTAGALSESSSTTAAVHSTTAAPTAPSVISAGPSTATSPDTTPPAPSSPAEETAPAPLAVIQDPARIEAPAHIDAQLVPLGLDTDGALEAPTDFDTAGWWQGGAKPGEPGPAVIAGHVDSYNGPAAFFSLRELKPGDAITVHGEDGTTVTFHVDRVKQHPKNQFPTQQVYGPTVEPELRLVTCAGAFDHATRQYSDNLIVYASS